MKPLKKGGRPSPPSTRAKASRRRGQPDSSPEQDQSKASPPSPKRHTTPPSSHSESSHEEAPRITVTPDRDESLSREGDSTKAVVTVAEERPSSCRSSDSNSSAASSNSSPNPSASRKTATFKARVPKKKYTSEHCSSSAGITTAATGNHGNASTPPLSSNGDSSSGSGAHNGTVATAIATAAQPQVSTANGQQTPSSTQTPPSQPSAGNDPHNHSQSGAAPVSAGQYGDRDTGERPPVASPPRCSSTDTASEHSADLEVTAAARMPAPSEPQPSTDDRPHQQQQQQHPPAPPPAHCNSNPMQDSLAGGLAEALAKGLKNQRVLARQGSGVFRAGVVRHVSGEQGSVEVQLNGEKGISYYPFQPSGGAVDLVLDSPPPGAAQVAIGTHVCVPFGGGHEASEGAQQLYREGLVTQVDPHPAVSFPYRVLLRDEPGAAATAATAAGHDRSPQEEGGGASPSPVQAVWVSRQSLRLLVPPWDLDPGSRAWEDREDMEVDA
ncbi:hypothetical protein AALO_G00259180 [Alosa alosa]|uniref:Protein capicua homolog-like domain-containing protein n=2 Tax=Alosa alosa TaxID=278164 RepID=A0AAV6FUQ3_9TELE|nr:hypothetical protein AALO_G00259180 [Alosa alosa]